MALTPNKSKPTGGSYACRIRFVNRSGLLKTHVLSITEGSASGGLAPLGMLEKHVLSLVEGAASGVLPLLPDLRAHRLAALRGVRAHVLRVRSARPKGCGLAGRTFLNIPSR